jgi:hypothetical protein
MARCRVSPQRAARRRPSRAVLVATALVSVLGSLLVGVTGAASASADGPGAGAPWVVSIGDSYVSGEAGRWAGSTNLGSRRADALGPTAYFDDATGTAEQMHGCHRSRSQEGAIGGAVHSVSFACSGAKTSTYRTITGQFKPGVDFADDGPDRQGQAAMLRGFARTHDVRMVLVGIGGNDFGFATVIASCVGDFLASSVLHPNYCADDPWVRASFTAAHVAAVRARVSGALQNVRTAMRQAGYADSSWTMVVQNYASPIPPAAGFRYGQSKLARQAIGGCGFWNRDADWANRTALATINATVRAAVLASGVTGVKQLDLSASLNGRRLCEKGVGLYEEEGLRSWTAPGAVDRTEWVNQIRTVTTAVGSYQLQESLHPNYWAQLALRSCVRQVWNAGAPRGGSCAVAGTGLVAGEPRMTLSPA